MQPTMRSRSSTITSFRMMASAPDAAGEFRSPVRNDNVLHIDQRRRVKVARIGSFQCRISQYFAPCVEIKYCSTSRPSPGIHMRIPRIFTMISPGRQPIQTAHTCEAGGSGRQNVNYRIYEHFLLPRGPSSDRIAVTLFVRSRSVIVASSYCFRSFSTSLGAFSIIPFLLGGIVTISSMPIERSGLGGIKRGNPIVFRSSSNATV